MTDKLLIDRATLEQMVGMLEKAENAMAYGTPVDGDKLDEMIAKGRAALANAEPTDWKATAMELAQRVNFAVTNCDCKGGGMLNTETMKVQDWRSYMADAMDLIPGVKVDREILSTLYLPKSKQKAAQAKIKDERKKDQL